MDYNTIIIGAGPAGMTASIQLKRAGIDFAIFEKGHIGGLLWNANLVENYPGSIVNLPGPKIVERFSTQVRNLGIRISKEAVIFVKENAGAFQVKTDSNDYSAANIIIATGTKPRVLAEPKLDQEIYYEVRPLLNVRDSNIAVIGGGDAAFDYALNMSRFNQVSIFFRKKEPACIPLLYKRAKENINIMIFPETTLDCLSSTAVHNNNKIEFDYLLAAIGRDPNTDFLSPELKNHLLEKKSLPGLYFAGDVHRGKLRQLAVAVGDGMSTAMEIINGSTSSP